MTLTTETFLDALQATQDDWRLNAVCSLGAADYERLDPITGGYPTESELAVRTKAAQELCAYCPVRAECGAEADKYRSVGVRGGSLRYEAGPATRRGEYRVLPLIGEAM